MSVLLDLHIAIEEIGSSDTVCMVTVGAHLSIFFAGGPYATHMWLTPVFTIAGVRADYRVGVKGNPTLHFHILR